MGAHASLFSIGGAVENAIISVQPVLKDTKKLHCRCALTIYACTRIMPTPVYVPRQESWVPTLKSSLGAIIFLGNS